MIRSCKNLSLISFPCTPLLGSINSATWSLIPLSFWNSVRNLQIEGISLIFAGLESPESLKEVLLNFLYSLDGEIPHCFSNTIIMSFSYCSLSTPLLQIMIFTFFQYLKLRISCLQTGAPFKIPKMLYWCFNRELFCYGNRFHWVKSHLGMSFLRLCRIINHLFW